MILLIDNYDSFVHNLARYFRVLGCRTRVIRNDQTDIESIRKLSPTAIVLSPGPCTPSESGICLDIVSELQQQFPILGICLGHQAIVQAFGGEIVRAAWPFHGRASQIWHNGTGVFNDIKNPFQVGRYHSLIADAASMPDELTTIAKTKDHVAMAVQHVRLPIVGLQFHPESVLTENGLTLLQNFLTLTESRIQDEAVL